MPLNWYWERPRNVDNQFVYHTPYFMYLYSSYLLYRGSWYEARGFTLFTRFEVLGLELGLTFSLYWEEGNSFGDIGIDSHGVLCFPICAGLSA